MRIAIDATPLTVATGGVARYTAELARSLAECDSGDEIFLLSDQRFINPCPRFANVRCGTPPSSVLEKRWWLWGLTRELSRKKADVFHGADFAVPYLPAHPSVMTVHDLSPWMDPAWHNGTAARIRSRTPLLLRMGLPTMVVTPSRAVRSAVLDRFRLRADRVVAVPLAAPDNFRPAAARNTAKRPYFLYVGTLEPRKNLFTLISAWREVRRTHDVDLLLAGRIREDFTPPAPESGLHLLGAVEDRDLPALYSNAVACVYPSHYEGFGLPVLEAMQCGAAVITSRDPAISEVASGAALQVDAGDERAWKDALAAAAAGGEWLEKLRSGSLRRAAEFSWQRTAALTREVYVEAARRFRR